MNLKQFTIAFPILQKAAKKWTTPIITYYAEKQRTPYEILISTVLSLRTKDETTAQASRRLFALANTPEKMLKLSAETIAETIYPVGFYKRKAQQILQISQILIETFSGMPPQTLEELLTLPGVGRKTANLTLSLGHNLPGLCVDTHVHRICNRWGLIATKTPEKTEFALRELLPQRYWQPINDLLVSFGQNICRPISPICSQCPIAQFCSQINVEKSR